MEATAHTVRCGSGSQSASSPAQAAAVAPLCLLVAPLRALSPAFAPSPPPSFPPSEGSVWSFGVSPRAAPRRSKSIGQKRVATTAFAGPGSCAHGALSAPRAMTSVEGTAAPSAVACCPHGSSSRLPSGDHEGRRKNEGTVSSKKRRTLFWLSVVSTAAACVDSALSAASALSTCSS
eukprot:4100161-Pleurochrysis_carterae.AAC.2